MFVKREREREKERERERERQKNRENRVQLSARCLPNASFLDRITIHSDFGGVYRGFNRFLLMAGPTCFQ